ncbi:MAG TPA: tetratricopeptide repeat protein [Bryobacteraceae bacterium]
MARAFFAACLFACVVSAQKAPEPAEPPEEDESLIPKVYALNPVQAKKEIIAGDYYLKKPNYSAAMRRYLEATRWDPGSAEAFLKLGEAHEKLHEYGPAREAYQKYIAMGEDPKVSDALRKKMAKWPDAAKTTGKK